MGLLVELLLKLGTILSPYLICFEILDYQEFMQCHAVSPRVARTAGGDLSACPLSDAAEGLDCRVRWERTQIVSLNVNE